MGKIQSVNEIVNDSSMKDSFKKESHRINESMKRNPSPRVKATEYLADKLVNIFDAPQARKFFLKCAWHLSEDTIWSAVEDTRKKCVRNKVGLFIFICNNALQELPVKK